MNKKTSLAVLLAAIFLLPLVGLSQEPVHWEVTLDSALRVAGRTDRLVLILFSGPDCVYCRRLEAQVLPDADVTAELRADYVPVKINPDHFPSTAKQYGVTGLPTTVIVSPQGQLIDSVRGWVKPSEYGTWLHAVAVRARPGGSLYAQIPAGAAPPAAIPAGRYQPSPLGALVLARFRSRNRQPRQRAFAGVNATRHGRHRASTGRCAAGAAGVRLAATWGHATAGTDGAGLRVPAATRRSRRGCAGHGAEQSHALRSRRPRPATMGRRLRPADRPRPADRQGPGNG